MGPDELTFNHFLLDAEEPLLFHTGLRALFPGVRERVAQVIPLERLRWISFGHVEADECGSMNDWLATSANAQLVLGRIGCDVSINDLADRPPMMLDEGQVLDLGGRRVRLLCAERDPVSRFAQARVQVEDARRRGRSAHGRQAPLRVLRCLPL